MRSLLPLAALVCVSLTEPLPEADPTADPAILAPGLHPVLAAGHHAPGHYGYEAAGYCANGGQCVPPVRIVCPKQISEFQCPGFVLDQLPGEPL